jgi:hypothetical protein
MIPHPNLKVYRIIKELFYFKWCMFVEDNLPVLHFKSILLITGFTLRQFLNSANLSPSNKVHFQCLVTTNIK